MTIQQAILAGLSSGPATLPKLAPKARPIVRYIAARRLETLGLIARVGTVRTKTMRGGLPRVVYALASQAPTKTHAMPDRPCYRRKSLEPSP